MPRPMLPESTPGGVNSCTIEADLRDVLRRDDPYPDEAPSFDHAAYDGPDPDDSLWYFMASPYALWRTPGPSGWHDGCEESERRGDQYLGHSEGDR